MWVFSVPLVWNMYQVVFFDATADASWMPTPIFNALVSWSIQPVWEIAAQILLIELTLISLLVWWVDTLK